MLKDLVKQYNNLEVQIPDYLKSCDDQEKEDHIKEERKKFLINSLRDLTLNKSIQWIVFEEGKMARAPLAPDSVIIVQEIAVRSSRYTGGTEYTHVLMLSERGKEMLTLQECHEDRHYYESVVFSGSLPIVGLYDLVTKRERKVYIAHVCGLQGFGELEDVCPACEAEHSEQKEVTDESSC